MARRRDQAGFRRTGTVVAACAVVTAAAGCASVSPRGDLERAAELVQRGVGGAGDRPPWGETDPAPDSDLWDGISVLTSDTAVRLALRSNPQIRADLETIAMARADLVQAGLLPNPVLTVALEFPVSGGGATEITIGAMQMLSALWRRPHRVAAAEAQLRRTVLSVADEALQLAAHTRAAHARAVYAESSWGFQDELASHVRRRLELITLMVEAGEASAADVAAATLAMAEAEQALLSRRRDAEVSRRELLQLIGRAEADAAFALPRHWDLPQRAGTPPDELAAIELASTQRLEVAAAMAARDAASAALREAGLAPLPELSAGLIYERTTSGERILGPALELEVPIFDTGAARKAGAAAEARRVDLAAQAVLQRVIREVRVSHREHAAAAAAADLARTATSAAANELLRYARAAHQAGELSLLDAQEAEIARWTAELEVLDRELAAALASIALERALGGRWMGDGDDARIRVDAE